MEFLYIGLGVAAFLAIAILTISYICFRMAFYVKESDKVPKEEYPIPEGEIYEPYRDQMVGWIKEVRAMPCQEFRIKSFDGLNLRGKYYEYAPGAIIEILFHGYRGSAERDMCGGVQRCFKLGHSALIVDQRCTNLIEELKMYSWEEDAMGNRLEIPKKEYDHGIDAMSYALGYDIFAGTKFEASMYRLIDI